MAALEKAACEMYAAFSHILLLYRGMFIMDIPL